MLIEDAARLAKIDHLYSLRLDQYVSLPVLVVVGDQSSGKSSVLEALTGLPFPRDSVLCTRFPTQIIFRRSPERYVDVSIIPATNVKHERDSELQDFAKSLSHQNSFLECDELLNILHKAAQAMGLMITTGHQGDVGKSFSNDLLKIQLSGPEHDHFSVIDLPGLFRKPTPGQTTKEDMSLVRNLVSAQLKNERSIILAVVPANVDVATQEIIQMAEDADPDRKRTLAVFTKPDLVDKGAEEHIVALINRTSSTPGLGYVIVCNRSQRHLDISLSERNEKERIFLSQEPWNAIPEDRAGVISLKQRLNSLAVEASRQSFEEVRLEIIKKMTSAKKRLKVLGSPRQTVESQRLFLLQLSSEYQALINKATDAYYGRDECFRDYPSLRLATQIMEENEKFANIVTKKGYQRVFSNDQKSDTDSEPETPPVTPEPARGESDLTGELIAESTEGNIPAPNFPELRLFLHIDKSDPVRSKEPVRTWIARKYHDFRGFEVGSSNPSLITALVYEQTSSWGHYALAYVGNVIARVHCCIHDLLKHLCPDSSVHSRLWTFLLPRLHKTYAAAIKQTEFLVEVERNGYPITLNHYFAQTMLKRRKARFEKRLKEMKAWQTNDDARQPLLRLDDILNSYASNEEHRIEELEDVLQSYHKVARKRFVDNVCKQAVDHMLICSKQGPLYVFSAECVGMLQEDDLQRLAGEDKHISKQRSILQSEVEVLELGQAVLA